MTTTLIITMIEALLLGGILGGVGGLLGIGGGIIAIPVLAWLYGLNQSFAQGTALVMIVPNVLIGFWRYRQRNPFPLRTALSIGLASMLSAYPAARLAVALDASTLRMVFALFLLWLSGYFAWNSRADSAFAQPKIACWNARYLPIVGAVGGLFAGFFSVGSGVVAAPIFVRGFGKRQAVAQGLALALAVPSAVVALATYSQAQHVDWQLGIPLAIGGMMTVSKGVALAHQLPERRLKQVFALMLLMTASLMIWKG